MKKHFVHVPLKMIRYLMICAVLLSAGLIVLPGRQGFAFTLYEMEILEKEAISKLSDEALVETYINVLVELEAGTTFSKAAGFNEKEYRRYKKLLRYRVDLMRELQKRQLEIPKITP